METSKRKGEPAVIIRGRRIHPGKLAECIFDILYLLFVFSSAVVFLVNADGKPVLHQYALLCLVLGVGDACHLLPRVKSHLLGEDERTVRQMRRGMQITSITISFFYLILYMIWESLFRQLPVPKVIPMLIYVTVIARVLLCLLPQNRWLSKSGNYRLSLIRNAVFLITGCLVGGLFLYSGDLGGFGLWKMAVAILISFVCYIPVVIWSGYKPVIGMLMIPKTMAYIWMLVMGLQLISIMNH